MFWSESMQLWVERIPQKGKAPKQITGKTQKILKAKIKAFEAEQHKGVLFADAADAWENAHDAKVEETTANSYAPHVRRAKEFFEGEYIKDITPDEVQAYVDYLVSLDYAKDTVRRGLVVVNKIFKHAITQPGSEIRYNPCSAVEIPRGLKQTRREPPTEEQLKRVHPDPEKGLIAWFLLCTGLRPSEMLALRWDDIDFDAMEITINKAATYPTGRAKVKDRTKTAAGMRKVPLLNALADVLPRGKKGYVFGGAKPLDKQQFYRQWTDWCKDVGLAEEIVEKHRAANNHEYTKHRWKPLVTPYQFRHEYASMLEDENVSEFDAQHVMGHSSITITKDKYTHFRDAKKLKNSGVKAKLDARFEKEV